MCVCARVCVFIIECGWLQILTAQLWEIERGGSQGGKDETERVQSSEADDCVFVRANLLITDAREISIEMILVTASPWISPMADTQNVYVYRTGGESREGQGCEGERGRETMRYEGDNTRGKIR